MRNCFLFLLTLTAYELSAQQFTLYSSRYTDLSSKSTSRIASVIYIDSSRVTISQGTSNLYLDVKDKKRMENMFYYTVLNFNDEECMLLFSPEQMVMDYKAGQFHLKYYIDSIQQEQSEGDHEAEENDSEEVSDTTETDSVVEDIKIYLSADTPPEFPGGSDAMKQWLNENVKYPAAAKKDKIMGLVEVNAVVEKDGSLSDVKVKRDIGGDCGKEAVRAVSQMPPWIPGQIKGEDKRVKVTIKAFFPPK